MTKDDFKKLEELYSQFWGLKQKDFNDDIFYYDETNNVRKFYLTGATNTTTGFNVEHDLYFVLGGLWVRNGVNVDIQSLLSNLKLQTNIKEIKFKHIAKQSDDFMMCLDSKKLKIYLDWLIDSNIKIHLMTLNYLYYSIVDIIDSILVTTYQSNPAMQDQRINRMLKDALYTSVRWSIHEYSKLLHMYHFPNIDRQNIHGFVKGIYEIFMNYHNTLNQNELNSFQFELLRQMLKASIDNEELTFLHDNEQDVTFDSDTLSQQYLAPIIRFKFSKHIFDKEVVVVKEFDKKYDIHLKENNYKYDFIDSEQDVMVQLSDVIVGLFGRYYNYMEKTFFKETNNNTSFTDLQYHNYRQLMKLMDISDAVCPFVFNYIGPNCTQLAAMHFERNIKK